LWEKIEGLVGNTIHTVGRNKSFHIIDVTNDKCIVRVESTGKLRTIQRVELEKALRIGTVSSLNTSILRQKGASEANPAYVLAILKRIS
jgi:hypothetical protein